MLYLLIVWAIQMAMFARFVTRFGFHPAWVLAVLIPFASLVMLWFVAFAPWPIPDRNQQREDIATTFA